MKLDKSLELYIRHLKYEKNLSLNTISAYKKDLLHFINYLKGLDVAETEDLNLNVFRKYLKFLDNFRYSNRTIIRKYSSFMNFFKFLEDNDYINVQLTQFIHIPKKHHVFYSFLSQREVEKLLESIRPEDDIATRDRAIIELIYSTGARVSEVANILIKDISVEKREVKVTGKGRKSRIVYLNQNALYWLNMYLKIRSKFGYSKKVSRYINSENLFLNKFGGPLSTRSICYIVKKYLRKAGIEKNITPHGIRHSFATHLLQEGVGIREIQELLGHENISTTQIYTHLNIKKLKREYRNFHPRAN